MGESNIIKYTSRDYRSALEDIITSVPSLTSLWSPDSEADPGYVLCKILASAIDMLSTNTDWIANELLAPTVSERKIAEKLFGLIGYRLSFYTAATTEVTLTNTSTTSAVTLDLSFKNNAMCTLNAYTDITNADRVITYNILPNSGAFTSSMSRATRTLITDGRDIFNQSDIVVLQPGESITRVAIEGHIRSYSVTYSQIKTNNYVLTLPSQHVDTKAIWVVSSSDNDIQWTQAESPSDFVELSPQFAITYDRYNNAQIQISNYIDSLSINNTDSITIYWIDCSGVIGCVGADALSNLQLSGEATDVESISISNLSNTSEQPHTYTISGKSPETAQEAYKNSRNFINTYDSIITLPDFTKFIRREPGISAGIAVDCQDAIDRNIAIYEDDSIVDSIKSRKYINETQFPISGNGTRWDDAVDRPVLSSSLTEQQRDKIKSVIAPNFDTRKVMCYAIYNDFEDLSLTGRYVSDVVRRPAYMLYRPSQLVVDNIKRDFKPIRCVPASVDIGYIRVFNYAVIGTLYLTSPVSKTVGDSIISNVKIALRLAQSSNQRDIGYKPQLMDIVSVVTASDSRIAYFDVPADGGISWIRCDETYFNSLSFARYSDSDSQISIAPAFIR